MPTTQAVEIFFLLGPFWLLLLAIPVLLLGEQMVSRVPVLARLSIPAAVMGGLIVALTILAIRTVNENAIGVNNRTASVAWHWIGLPQWDLSAIKPASVTQPLLVLFFTCIGLNASWAVAGKGSGKLFLYLFLAGVLAVLQYASGIGTALVIGESALMGMMCSGVALMGGFGTAAGFSQEFEKAGLANASSIGVAAAAFGVVVGGLISGPLGQWIVNSQKLVTPGKNAVSTTTDANSVPDSMVDEGGFFDDLRNMFARPGQTLLHVLVLLTCVKLGVFISVWVVEVGTPLVRSIPGVAQDYKLAFPTYMGAMILAVIVRNIHDAIGLKFLSSKHIDVISSFVLAWFLTAVMIALQLRELIDSAAAMLIIMAVQVGVMVIFARWVVFYVMGRDYEAAAMSSGMVGFGLGATSNALASIKALTLRFGPAPQAVIITSVVGAFLIDFINAIMITFGLNVFR